MQWRWSEEKATLAYCAKQHLQDYDIERDARGGHYTRIDIRNKDNHRLLYRLVEGHEHIVFTRRNDTLFIAEYSPIATGCEVVALDLKTGAELWRSRLQGIGPTAHSEYSNRVNIDADGKRIIVMGNEADGQYIEQLDMQTGETVANRKFDAHPRNWWDRLFEWLGWAAIRSNADAPQFAQRPGIEFTWKLRRLERLV